jgi:hypothetical protein
MPLMARTPLPTHWGHPTGTTCAEPSDHHLFAVLTPLVLDPLPMPGWTLPAWRKAMQRPERAPILLQSSFDAGRLQPLLAWVSSTTGPSQHLGAVAAALAVLDTALHSGQPDVTALARELRSAVLAVRPLATRLHPQARTLASPFLDRRPDPAGGTDLSAQRTDSPFLSPASLLLRQAGYELRADAALADRLAATLDVVVAHWASASQPGEGLPAFFAENPLRSTKRLAVRLGRDRDLMYLLYGPQPGRGRPLQVARRRGLAYWAALAWLTERAGEPPPQVPGDAVAHWSHELSRLAPEATPGLWAALLDSSDTHSA